MTHMDEYYEYNYDDLVPEWNYEEFSHLEVISNTRTPFARAYKYGKGEFYIEPWFYTQLTRLFERFPSQKEDILKVFFFLAKKGQNVVFTRDIHAPIFKDDNYVYYEISEVVEEAGLKFDDISRGSDYGD